MSAILTVTLNPTIDVSCEAEQVNPTHKIRTHNDAYYPGGGGINVARVVQKLGGDVTALFLSGGVPGEHLCDMLGARGIAHHAIPVREATRMCFTVFERCSGEEFRFVPEGPHVDPKDIAACMDYLRQHNQFEYVVVSGSLPPNAPNDTICEIADIAAANGARMVLDSSGPALAAALEKSKMYLVKPSQSELEGVVGHPLDHDGMRAAAQELVDRGTAELVAVTMGHEGAWLVTDKVQIHLPSIPVKAASAVGAGDSFVAAITLALSRGQSVEDALCYGSAAGAAAVLTPGTELCRAPDVDRFYTESKTGAP